MHSANEMIDEQKLLSLLGLAQKAGKLVSGEFAIEKAVRTGKIQCVLVAANASDATKQNYRNMAAYYGVPHYELLSKEKLSGCIGKGNRAAVALADKGFALAAQKLLSRTT